MGYVAAHKTLVAVIGLSAIVVVGAVVMWLASGRLDATTGRANPQNFILDDSTYVVIVENAAILESEEVPRLVAEIFGYDGEGPKNTEERNATRVPEETASYDDQDRMAEEWYDEFRRDFGSEFEDVAYSITRSVYQEGVDGKQLGNEVLIGNFEFDAMRNGLEDEFEEASQYRGFEVWNRRNVAILDDRGTVIWGEGLVEGVLKALHTGRGAIATAEDSGAGWNMKRALDKVGGGLITLGFTDCTGYVKDTFILYTLRGCYAVAWAVKGGDSYVTEMEVAYVFTSARRAESGMDDIQDAVYESDADIDLEKIEVNEDIVTIEITIHH